MAHGAAKALVSNRAQLMRAGPTWAVCIRCCHSDGCGKS
jgi:hypothetical protein